MIKLVVLILTSLNITYSLLRAPTSIIKTVPPKHLNMLSKKLINNVDQVVPEALDGYLVFNPNVKRLGSLNIVVRSDIDESKQSEVSLISGGWYLIFES